MKTFIFLLLLLSAPMRALAGSITANVDQTQFESGEEVTLTVEVEGSLDGDPDLGNMADFQVGGRSQSTQVQIINGSMTKRSVYTFSLLPQKNGALTIPPVVAQIDGKKEQTLPIAITAGGGQNNTSPGASRPNGQTSEPDLYFMERTLSPGPYYRYMPIVESIHIYRRAEWQEASKNVVSSPDWQIYELKEDEKRMEVRGGVNYSVITLKRVLVPLKSGTLKLPDMTVVVQFVDPRRRQRSNPFDIFSGGMLAKRQLNLEQKTLGISELPEPDLPVGELTPSVDLKSTSVKVGDSVTMEFKVSGKAWFSGMALNPPVLNGAFKVYKDQPETTEEPTGEGLVGSKSLKISLVPSEPGSLQFAPWVFRYLDIKTGKLVEKSISIPALEVTGSKEDMVISGPPPTRPSGEKDKPRAAEPSFHAGEAKGFPLSGGRRYFVGTLLSFSVFFFLLGLGIWGQRRWASAQNPDYAPAQKAWKALKSTLERESTLEAKIQKFKAYSAVRMRGDADAVSIRDVIEVLTKDRWSEEALGEVKDMYKLYDQVKFSGRPEVDPSGRGPGLNFSPLEIKRRKPWFQ